MDAQLADLQQLGPHEGLGRTALRGSTQVFRRNPFIASTLKEPESQNLSGPV